MARNLSGPPASRHRGIAGYGVAEQCRTDRPAFFGRDDGGSRGHPGRIGAVRSCAKIRRALFSHRGRLSPSADQSPRGDWLRPPVANNTTGATSSDRLLQSHAQIAGHPSGPSPASANAASPATRIVAKGRGPTDWHARQIRLGRKPPTRAARDWKADSSLRATRAGRQPSRQPVLPSKVHPDSLCGRCRETDRERYPTSGSAR